MPRRLAITISGAVSLGSYEAGVLYEILSALERNNLAATRDEDRVVIDVLCGASAGGMTAAIAAQVLLDPRGRMNGPHDNAFYHPWVRDADLSLFLQDTPQDNPRLSLLASSQVEAIASRFIGTTIAPDAPAHPAAAPDIRLGLALSNLHGVDYARETVGARGQTEKFIYTRFQDEFLRTVRRAGAAQPVDWPQIRQAALACGAFPFAFRPRDLTRSFAEYATQHSGLDVTQFPSGRDNTYTYSDGGIFHNEPLGIARDLVSDLNGGQPEDADTRFYLFVSPDAQASKRPEAKSPTNGQPPLRLGADTETMPRLVGHLVNAIFTQGRFQDWIVASKVNDRVRRLDTVARGLADQLFAAADAAQGGLTAPLPPALTAVTTTLLPALYPAAALESGLKADRTRLTAAYTGFAASNGRDCLTELPTDLRAAWIDAVLLLEKTAGLEHKDIMTIFTITASSRELSGEPLFAFAGFLDFKSRHFDYEVGRKKAREWLTTNAVPGGAFPLLNVAAYPVPTPNPGPDLSGRQMSDFDEDKRRALRDRALDRASDALALPWWSAWLAKLLLRSALNKQLGL